MDICVEFTSMSKTFSMPGWRMGFAVGNERLISALTRVKSYLDYGAFTPIQVAATAALNGDGSDIAEVRSIYKRRRDVLVDSFGKAGWEVPPPACDDVCLGADSRTVQGIWDRWSSPSFWSRRPTLRWRPASALANMATNMSASRWSKTSTASARRRATSSASCHRLPPMAAMWFRCPRGVDRPARSRLNPRSVSHLRHALRAIPDRWFIDMTDALKIGIAGLGTVGAALFGQYRFRPAQSAWPTSAAAKSRSPP
jgi:hypothetical protein